MNAVANACGCSPSIGKGTVTNKRISAVATVFVGLHTCNLGTKTRHVTNPFTGESLTMPIDEGMEPEEIEAASAVMNLAGASDPDPDNYRTVWFTEGNWACVALDPIGAAIEGGVTLDIAEFIFRLATAGNMVVTSRIDPQVVAVLPGQQHSDLKDRWPNAAYIHSAAGLLEWIHNELVGGA
jgi:hypothetical protein